MTENIYPNPFSYNEEEQRAYKSFYTQREASYTKPSKEVYQGNGLTAFVYNDEAPTPQLAHIDGYKSKEEIED